MVNICGVLLIFDGPQNDDDLLFGSSELAHSDLPSRHKQYVSQQGAGHRIMHTSVINLRTAVNKNDKIFTAVCEFLHFND